MKITITQHNMPNSVFIHLPKSIRDNIFGNEVVITDTDGQVLIREAIIMDNKRLKIGKCNNVSYTSVNAKNLIGEFNYEIEGDYIRLSRK